jgi:hypothetical protein
VRGTEFAQQFQIVQQHLLVTFAQNFFENLPADFSRYNRRIGQRIQKTQKGIKSWRALQFDPCLPLCRFENAGNNVTDSVIVRDFKPL